jgi:hypothetical protein
MISIDGILNSMRGDMSSGATLSTMKSRLKQKLATVDPGDFALTSAGGMVTAYAPVSGDLWYLWNHVNGMTWGEPGANTRDYVDRRLAFLASKLHGIAAMRGITSKDNLTRGSLPRTEGWEVSHAGSWHAQAGPWFQLMAFEILFTGQTFSYNSEDFTPRGVVGYISFPVGQFGVMEVVSLIRESVTDSASFIMNIDERPVKASPSLLPPITDWTLNKCYGQHLVESGYSVTNSAYIYPAKTAIPEQKYGADVRPKGWGRLWITRRDTWPIPGEFVGILCKPTPIPHAWWYQESSPFLYAGNWVDTENLTSGVITEVTSDSTHPNGTTCVKYKIRIHGNEVYVFSSDFVVYDAGTRVGVLKVNSTQTSSFMSYDFAAMALEAQPELNAISEQFVIVPITFFGGVT